jgi:RimJ/RimL family protein N-acetyltransferase
MHDRPRVSGGAGREDALKLVSVYDTAHYDLLYMLLGERTPEQSISHKAMPTFEGHRAFVDSRPYLAWYFVMDRVRRSGDSHFQSVFGACYLSLQREIGVSIFKSYRGKGRGKWAVQELMRLHPGRFLANINPANTASARLFTSLGFNLVQHTYAK